MRTHGMIGRLIARIYWRETALAARIRPYLAEVQSIIDIGAGGCRLAHLITTRDGIPVTAVDIVDHNTTSIPLALYDGKKLPFADQAFDVSLLVFVLHHAADPAALLSEAVRVARSAVLVVEDTPMNAAERTLWRAWDYALNHALHEDIDIAHTARNTAQWMDFIDQAAGVPIADSLNFRMSYPLLRTYRHTLFHMPLQRPAIRQ
jgi:ubiquinone/menaquinone biosynthesis C-methylase UbiE